jgi:putative DNA primase/helicase
MATGGRVPFRVKDDGVFWLKPDGEDGVEPVWLCDRLDILADTRDAAGDGWGRLLRWRDGDGREHQWVMPVRLLAGEASAVRERLVDGGLRITPNARLRERLVEYLFTMAGRKVHCAERGGWHGGSFLLPGWSATAPGAEELIFQSPTGAAGRTWRTAGTVAEWRDGPGALCVGNSLLTLAASIGFAGPLLELAGADGGGFHLTGASSCGKTTALQVGLSVTGGGADGGGKAHSWRTTDNGLEAIAAEHNDASIFLDELGQLDARKVADSAYMLANGRPKQRMSKTLAARDTAAWRLMFFLLGSCRYRITRRRRVGERGEGWRSGW